MFIYLKIFSKNLCFFYNTAFSLNSSFVSIGTSSYPFRGIFKSKDVSYRISNLNKPLFGYTNGANISYIEIESGNISYNSNYVGSVVGNATNSTINKCYNLASVSNTKSSGTIYTGGIVGYATGGSIRECTNASNVGNSSDKVDKSYVGGIFGYAEPTVNISDCVVHNPNRNISIIAKAKTTKTDSVVRSTNDSVYYSKLEAVNQKAQDSLNNAKSVLASKENTEYKFFLKFWAQATNMNILTPSEAITRTVKFENNGFFGPVTNGSTYCCYYYEKEPKIKSSLLKMQEMIFL